MVSVPLKLMQKPQRVVLIFLEAIVLPKMHRIITVYFLICLAFDSSLISILFPTINLGTTDNLSLLNSGSHYILVNRTLLMALSKDEDSVTEYTIKKTSVLS